MPAGVSWPRYITFLATSILTASAGAQLVHIYYRPLDDIEELVEQGLENRRKAREIIPIQSS